MEMRRRLYGWVCVLLLAVLPAAGGAEAPPRVLVAELKGAISPASAAYFTRALDEAARQQAALLVVRLDTPGGLDSAMREMIQDMLASPVPVAMFVAPGGARAASAGTYLLYAAHVAAMTPGTNLGAATPVQIGMGGERERSPKPRGNDETGASGDAAPAAGPAGDGKGAARQASGVAERKAGPSGGGAQGSGTAGGDTAASRSADSVAAAKATHDAAAYLRSLAQLRGRNADWAELAVREAVSLSAQDAVARGVVDLLANDVPDLLARLEGRRVVLPTGERTLALAGATVVEIVHNWQEALLSRIADPNVALILMMLGVYGLLFEFYTPGGAAPGVIGGICLLLGLYGLALLPVNFAGVALLLLGIALMVGEAFLPSFGIVGIGGVVAFVAGALMLVDGQVPGLTVAWQVVVPLAVASGLFIALIAGFALRARKRPAVAGREAMLGAPVVAIDDFATPGSAGWVSAFGERWQARSKVALAPGGRGRVVGVEGLTLIVDAGEERQGDSS